MAVKKSNKLYKLFIKTQLFFITPLLAHEGATGVIKERMDKFKMSKKMMKTIHRSIQNEDFETIGKSGITLLKWSKEMINYFPEGSEVAPSEASGDIWLDPEGFKKAVNKFELASLKLVDNSKEKNFDKTVVAFRGLARTCKGCHQKFRN